MSDTFKIRVGRDAKTGKFISVQAATDAGDTAIVQTLNVKKRKKKEVNTESST